MCSVESLPEELRFSRYTRAFSFYGTLNQRSSSVDPSKTAFFSGVLGLYMAVDLALVADVLPNHADAAKDLGVMNIAGALPSSVAPALAPAVLALGGGSYGVLYAVAGACAVLGALAILPVRRVR